VTGQNIQIQQGFQNLGARMHSKMLWNVGIILLVQYSEYLKSFSMM